MHITRYQISQITLFSSGGLRENLDEEISTKENLARQLEKAVNDGEMWRQRYEKEGVARAEELEMAKMKLSARLSENHSTIDQLNLKLSQLEKAKQKLSDDVTVMAQQLDQAQLMNSAMEKKAQQFDRIVTVCSCLIIKYWVLPIKVSETFLNRSGSARLTASPWIWTTPRRKLATPPVTCSR